MSLDDSQTLVLNADYRPVSYCPLSLWSWQDAVQAVFSDGVEVVAEYDRPVRSPSTVMNLPSVVALRSYIALPRRPAFIRSNLFLRDQFRCQYCGQRFKSEEPTFDHRCHARAAVAPPGPTSSRPAWLATSRRATAR